MTAKRIEKSSPVDQRQQRDLADADSVVAEANSAGY